MINSSGRDDATEAANQAQSALNGDGSVVGGADVLATGHFYGRGRLPQAPSERPKEKEIEPLSLSGQFLKRREATPPQLASEISDTMQGERSGVEDPMAPGYKQPSEQV